jgi:hypothetical protein
VVRVHHENRTTADGQTPFTPFPNFTAVVLRLGLGRSYESVGEAPALPAQERLSDVQEAGISGVSISDSGLCRAV